MLDDKRIIGKLGELDSYIDELEAIIPKNYSGYINSKETKRACERLLHISIECMIDICTVIIAELRLGPPAEEETIFGKLRERGVISEKAANKLKVMKKFRNVLVHHYGAIDDKIVYRNLKTKLKDFYLFKKEILSFLKRHSN